MKTGKKGRQVIFQNSACLPFDSLKQGFFPRAGKATATCKNIKEDV